jgi:hypothetical protein
MNGTIGFCRKKAGFIAKVLRWFTRSDWSHTYIICQVDPEVLVLEAGRLKVQSIPITKYESSKYANVYFTPGLFLQGRVDAGIAKAKERIEATYGWLQILRFLPVITAKRLLGMKISNPSKGGTVRSELVLQYLRGLEPGGKWDGMDRNSVSPEDLYGELVKHVGFDRVESS